MDVLARIKKLDEERSKLLEEAKANALATAERAVAELNGLGFNYRLVEGDAPRSITTRVSTGTRRSGIRDTVFDTIQAAGPDGIKPADIREKLGISNEDKRGAQSVANALSALKKASKIADHNGAYVVA